MKYLIDPVLPEQFDNTPNEERSPEEIAKYWDVPLIISVPYPDEDTYKGYCERMSGLEGYELETEQVFNERIEEARKQWFKHWPNAGIRYDVSILDGGCWDRPTWKGSYATLEHAIRYVEDTPEKVNKKAGFVDFSKDDLPKKRQ